MQFSSPSMRAAGQDLAISISPLGLVELSDEEFEVHGPRLNRYAHNWAWYLGHHWAYRREPGEPQFALNYVAALQDFITNFTFSRGVHFRSVKQYSHIIPGLLKRVWEVDNVKERVLWEMGQQGGVSGDCFVKVAYDPEYSDPAGGYHPGRCRILVVPGAHCFPEYHPHDQGRIIRFKMKYRFWGTAPDGTRQVFTYTEIMTEEYIEEYLNDELIAQRRNPIGTVPVVHIPNLRISGTPWGKSDIADVIPLNRELNEKALEVSDIINYHSAPITIITGAKMSHLEKGPRKMWSIPNDKARVENLDGATGGIAPALEYMERIKNAMHEMTGVPFTALGQEQAISNTSGVALAIMYLPMMQRYHMKLQTYGEGLEKINDLILRTLYVFEPDSILFNPSTEGIFDPDLPAFVDVRDPMAYRTVIHWPEPLPTDVLIKLNEVQLRMALNLESRRGALRELGEEFPDEKMREILEEQEQDVLEQGALDLFKAKINSFIIGETGIMPEADGGAGEPVAPPALPPEPPPTTSGGSKSPGPVPAALSKPVISPEDKQLYDQLVTLAAGTKLAQRRNPENT